VERLAGTGHAADPVRPAYAPPSSAIEPNVRTGILGYMFVASDDGKFALVEFVAEDTKAFEPILADATIKCFQRGRHSQAAVEMEFLKHKKNFDFANFGVRMP
jgi:hypothetical protein